MEYLCGVTWITSRLSQLITGETKYRENTGPEGERKRDGDRKAEIFWMDRLLVKTGQSLSHEGVWAIKTSHSQHRATWPPIQQKQVWMECGTVGDLEFKEGSVGLIPKSAAGMAGVERDALTTSGPREGRSR